MAPRPGSLGRVLKSHARDLGQIEDRQAGRVRELYRGFRLDLIDRLDYLDEPGARFTPTRYGRAATEIDEAMATFGKDFVRQLRDGIKPIAELSKRHLVDHLERFARWFPGSVKVFRPPLGEALEDAAELLVPQFEGSVGVYAERISSDLRQRLAVSLQAGEDGPEARRRIFGGYLQPVRAGQEEPVVSYWAHKILTDQTTRTRGTVMLELIGAGQAPQGKLQKRWCSTLDERTSDICEEMDGVVVDIDEPFTLPDGRQVMTPPGHPNCRADVIPWTEEWAGAEAANEPPPEVPAKEEEKPEEPPPPPAPITAKPVPEELKANAAAFASTLRQSAEREEPAVTAALQGFENADAKLIRLEYKLKSESSLQRKILDDHADKPDQSLAEVAAGIKDSLRYTFELEPEKYAETVPRQLQVLEEQGFLVSKFKNSWGPDQAYQGVNVNLQTPGGMVFELQFHTAESFHMKDKINHKLYEEYRLKETPVERAKELWKQMVDNQKDMPIPRGATEVSFESKFRRPG